MLFGRRRAPVGRLSLHLPVDEKPGQEGVCLKAAAYPAPVPKRLFRQIGEIERFPPGEAESAIVVRIVAGFLKLNEGGGDVDQRLLTCWRSRPDASLGGIDLRVNATALCFIAEW